MDSRWFLSVFSLVCGLVKHLGNTASAIAGAVFFITRMQLVSPRGPQHTIYRGHSPERGHWLRGCRRKRLGTCPRHPQGKKTRPSTNSPRATRHLSPARRPPAAKRTGMSALRPQPRRGDIPVTGIPRRGDMRFAGFAASGSAPVPGTRRPMRPPNWRNSPASRPRRQCPRRGSRRPRWRGSLWRSEHRQ